MPFDWKFWLMTSGCAVCLIGFGFVLGAAMASKRSEEMAKNWREHYLRNIK